MTASLLFHLLLLVLGWVWHPSGRQNRLIDFEKERVTFYQVAQGLPDISPMLPQSTAAPGSELQPRKAVPAEAQHADDQVDIRPGEGPQVERVLEQPEFETIKTLPRLELPAMLLRPPTRMEAPSLPRPVPPLETVPLLPPPTPEVEGVLQTTTRMDTLLQKPTLLLPSAPPPSPNPPVLNPIALFEEPETQVQLTDLAVAASGPRLAYSTSPIPPKGELQVPKVHQPGTISASPQGGTGKGPVPVSTEFGTASIVVPNAALRSQLPLSGTIPGVAVVQVPAPAPPPPIQEKPPVKEPTRPQVSRSLQDYLPTLTQSLPRSRSAISLEDSKLESPLTEAEREGREIFTAAINAPNFTSKRGSWIFRFAELLNPAQPSDSTAQAQTLASSSTHLTAPDAVLKVDPKYPPEVIRDKVEGVVVLYAIINKSGEVDPQSLQILRNLEPRLDLAARDALLRWRFKPSLKNGQPVAIQAEITIPFYSHREMFAR